MDALASLIEAPHSWDRPRLADLVRRSDPALRARATDLARQRTEAVFGNKVFIRGLIEIGNYCKNDCLYCGIRRSNAASSRYRLDADTILACCRHGYDLGFRTFVLQGGEDAFLTDEYLVSLVRTMRRDFPECAITLSLGERSRESYRLLREAGADRYLLRHETANAEHYGQLHPPELTLASRLQCLQWLKELGYQTGCGFMVGSPGQTPETLAEDLLFLRDFQPEMVGLGPFIPHADTPFRDHPPGDVESTLFLLSLVRLLLPRALLPATTALGTIAGDGREMGILAGANVVMPNLSPPEVRGKYLLYNNKLASKAEAAENLADLCERLAAIGREAVVDRGDFPK